MGTSLLSRGTMFFNEYYVFACVCGVILLSWQCHGLQSCYFSHMILACSMSVFVWLIVMVTGVMSLHNGVVVSVFGLAETFGHQDGRLQD